MNLNSLCTRLDGFCVPFALDEWARSPNARLYRGVEEGQGQGQAAT